MTLSERSGLINKIIVKSNEQEHDPTNARSRTTSNKYAIYLASGLLAAAVLYFYSDLRIWNAGRTKNLKNFGSMVRESSLRASATNTEIDTRPGVVYLPDIPLEGKKKKKNKEEQHSNEKKLESHAEPVQRCEWVVDIFTRKYAGRSREELCTQYAVQAADPNVFYRATAEIFWRDFKINSWGKRIDFETIGVEAVNTDGTPLQPYSTWTWITGDQVRRLHDMLTHFALDFNEVYCEVIPTHLIIQFPPLCNLMTSTSPTLAPGATGTTMWCFLSMTLMRLPFTTLALMS